MEFPIIRWMCNCLWEKNSQAKAGLITRLFLFSKGFVSWRWMCGLKGNRSITFRGSISQASCKSMAHSLHFFMTIVSKSALR